MDYCALATARSIPVAQEIAEHFADLDRQRDIGPLKIKISGCINACGHHHVGHIGILGLDRAGVENYQITLGGDGTETAAIGERAGPGFAYDEIVPAIERLIEAYLDLRESRARPSSRPTAALARSRSRPPSTPPRPVRCRLSRARFADPRSTGSAALQPTATAIIRPTAVLDARLNDPEFPARWRWSRPSGRRRRCFCTWSSEIDRDLPVLLHRYR